MKNVEILSDFDGYPNGREKRRFTTGDTPELSNEFADLIVGKGLARETAHELKAPPKPAPAKSAEQKDDAS